MPLDPSIALRARVPQRSSSPIRTLGSLVQLREGEELNEQRRLLNEGRRRELDDDTAIREALQRMPNPDDAIASLYQAGRADAAGALSKSYAAHKKAKRDDVMHTIDTQQRSIDFVTNMFAGVSDLKTLQSVRQNGSTILEGAGLGQLTSLFPTEYDPVAIQKLINLGSGASKRLAREKEALANAKAADDIIYAQHRDAEAAAKAAREAEEYQRKFAAGILADVKDQNDLIARRRFLQSARVPESILAEFGDRWSPTYGEEALKRGMTPVERQNATGAAAARAETARHNRATEERQRASTGDDPALPAGVSDYLVKLRDKYPTYEEAAGEFADALGKLRGEHPRLSSGKALDQLRRSFISTGRNQLDTLIAEAMSGGDAQPTTSRADQGARRPRTNAAAQANDLEERARQVLERAGYDSSPDSIRVFLSKPENRRRLSGGQ